MPLDLAGMASHELGGLGAIAPTELWPLASRYRFFFHPIRWTSLGLALLEAMTIGMPVVAVASTEVASVIDDGVSGVVDTRFDRLVERIRDLLRDPEEARRLGAAGVWHASASGSSASPATGIEPSVRWRKRASRGRRCDAPRGRYAIFSIAGDSSSSSRSSTASSTAPWVEGSPNPTSPRCSRAPPIVTPAR